tara:strand:- start:41209 stop:41619 length:411 start_codon:yes stop_codon:yes gene_type:complete
MQMPELIGDPRFETLQDRLANLEELDRIIGKWTLERSPGEVTSMLQEAQICAAPSLSSEGLFKDPHLKERDVFMQVDHPVMGKDWVTQPPWRLSLTPAAIDRCSPMLGEHNDQIFRDLLGMSEEEISRLEREQAIY